MPPGWQGTLATISRAATPLLPARITSSAPTRSFRLSAKLILRGQRRRSTTVVSRLSMRRAPDSRLPSGLQRSAELVTALCARHQVPAERISDADVTKLLRGDYQVRGGIIGHFDINRVARALGVSQSDHWDPGPSFPWMNYLGMIHGAFPSTNPLGEPDMPLTPADQSLVRAAVADALAAAIPVIATQAAVQVWTRYRMANNGGLVDLQTSLSLLLAGLPSDAARDAAVAAAVAAVPAETVAAFSTALTPPAAA